MAVNWKYYDKPEFDAVNKEYLPPIGEGDNRATQIVTAVNKLVYKWYNDGDVYDNTHALVGWLNDISSYANWLRKYAGAGYILDKIYECRNDSDYENLLKVLVDNYLDAGYLVVMRQMEKAGSIYHCDGPFKFVLEDEEDEEYDEDEDDDW